MEMRHITKHFLLIQVTPENIEKIARWYNTGEWEGIAHAYEDELTVNWYASDGRCHTVQLSKYETFIVDSWTGEPDRARGTQELLDKGYIEE